MSLIRKHKNTAIALSLYALAALWISGYFIALSINYLPPINGFPRLNIGFLPFAFLMACGFCFACRAEKFNECIWLNVTFQIIAVVAFALCFMFYISILEFA